MGARQSSAKFNKKPLPSISKNDNLQNVESDNSRNNSGSSKRSSILMQHAEEIFDELDDAFNAGSFDTGRFEKIIYFNFIS